MNMGRPVSSTGVRAEKRSDSFEEEVSGRFLWAFFYIIRRSYLQYDCKTGIIDI